MKSIYIGLIALFIFSSCNTDDELVIGTFNIAWLGDGIDDSNPRTEKDYHNISEIISALNPDIMALQEVENKEAIYKIVDTNNYYILASTYPNLQKTALIISKKLKIKSKIQLDEITLGNRDLRPAIVAHCQFGNFDFLVASLHFKSTSRYDDTPIKKTRSYEIRNEQSDILLSSVSKLSSELSEKDIILLGDLNDNPSKKNSNITQLENEDYDFMTSNLNSCKYSIWKTIDHIILSKSLIENFVPNSIFVYDTYSSFNEKEVEKISDHCPTIARIKVSPN